MRLFRAGVGVGVGAIFAVPASAGADDFRVTTLTDDASMEGPAGSLRRAVSDANGTAGSDRILFKSKLSGTIDLTEGIDIYGSDVEIVGPGARKISVTTEGANSIFAPYTGAFSPVAIDVAISGLSLTGSDAGNESGGAISSYANDGSVDLALSGVTISGNTAGTAGGGVSVRGASGGSLLIENSTISGNSTDGNGGGIYVYASELSVRNSTISRNTAGGDGGGALILADAEFRNSTVTENQADGAGGGIIEYNGATFRGVIVADNVAPTDPNLDDGTWETSFSLFGEADPSSFDDQGGNIFDADPNLKPLANNGGPTDTHAFKKSPAKNKGPGDAANSDQRGAPRKGQPDIGAYEFTKCRGVIVNRVGTAGKDKLKGTKRKDGILGLGGNDKLSGRKGKDGLCGGRGKDKLKGGPGKDKLKGGPGKDKEVQ